MQILIAQAFLQLANLLLVLLLVLDDLFDFLGCQLTCEIFKVDIVFQNATAFGAAFADGVLDGFHNGIDLVNDLLLEVPFELFFRKVGFDEPIVLLEVGQVLSLVFRKRVAMLLLAL